MTRDHLLAPELLEQVARAVELVAVPVITVGVDGVITSANGASCQLFDGDTLLYANGAAHKMFGTSSFGELFERFAKRLHLRPHERRLPDSALAAIAAGVRLDRPGQYVIVRPDGTERYVEWYTIPM